MAWNLKLPKIKLPTWINDCITGPDGQSVDAHRLAFIVAALSMIGAFLGVLIQHGNLDFLAFGGGFAALSAGSGIAIAAKQSAGAEPPGPAVAGDA